jgi:hypothetical protein
MDWLHSARIGFLSRRGDFRLLLSGVLLDDIDGNHALHDIDTQPILNQYSF